jgi:hypothetical protein
LRIFIKLIREVFFISIDFIIMKIFDDNKIENGGKNKARKEDIGVVFM